MAFLAMASQKSLFTLQKNQLQYEKTILMSRTNVITSQMADYANAQDEDADLDEDPFYISLQKTQEYLETQTASLDDQITALDSEINSLQTMVQNGIKSTCTLNLIGG